MDCLRSFSLTAAGTQNATTPQVDQWLVGAQHFWIYRSTNTSPSAFAIQGFKNIDIYKIELTGNIESFIGTTACLVQDWTAFIQITGSTSQIGGQLATPNGFNLVQQSYAPNYTLNKFTGVIEFASPIQSCTLFTLSQLYAQGIAYENVTTLGISWNLNFNIFYKFEGE